MPPMIIDPIHRILRWRNPYAIPIFIIPITAAVVQLVVSLHVDVRYIEDGLFCDIAEPVW